MKRSRSFTTNDDLSVFLSPIDKQDGLYPYALIKEPRANGEVEDPHGINSAVDNKEVFNVDLCGTPSGIPMSNNDAKYSQFFTAFYGYKLNQQRDAVWAFNPWGWPHQVKVLNGIVNQDRFGGPTNEVSGGMPYEMWWLDLQVHCKSNLNTPRSVACKTALVYVKDPDWVQFGFTDDFYYVTAPQYGKGMDPGFLSGYGLPVGGTLTYIYNEPGPFALPAANQMFGETVPGNDTNDQSENVMILKEWNHTLKGDSLTEGSITTPPFDMAVNGAIIGGTSPPSPNYFQGNIVSLYPIVSQTSVHNRSGDGFIIKERIPLNGLVSRRLPIHQNAHGNAYANFVGDAFKGLLCLYTSSDVVEPVFVQPAEGGDPVDMSSPATFCPFGTISARIYCTTSK